MPFVATCFSPVRSGLDPIKIIVVSRLSCANLRFDFFNSLDQPAFDLLHSRTFAEVSSLVEVLEIGLQLEQQLVGKSMTHDGLIVHCER